MHVCTRASGNTLSIACGKPLSPSTHAISTSRTPRFFSSVSTPSQNLAPSLALVHSPSTSLRPSRSTPMATYTARFSTRPSAHLHIQRIQKNDPVNRFQRPILPGLHFVHDGVRHFRNQRWTDFCPVHLSQMALDLACRHA